jgi:uncharacterized protein (TIGR03437 family)
MPGLRVCNQLVLLLVVAMAGWAQTTRVEQADPSVSYSGTWYANSNSLHSGSSAALTNAQGARAGITFNGTGISWIGVSDPYAGIAWVYLDGTLNTVDTYTAATDYQHVLFSAKGLPAGLHTLTIEVPHIRDGSTQGSWVWIDAFDIENGSGVVGGASATAGRIEENNAALSYTGIWFPKTSAVFSGGGATEAVDTGSRVTVTFNGTSIIWIAYRDEDSGIARVYVDGTLKATVDTYLSPAQAQAAVYNVTGLPLGTHTLTIEVTGTHNPSSVGSWIWVDGFEVSGGVSSGGAPTVAGMGVVNGASFTPAPGNQVTQGQIISIFGSNFLASGRADASGTPLPTQLGPVNTMVSACGQNLPLFNVFPGQINAQLPFECPASGTTQLTVTVGGQASIPQTISLAAASPGIFTVTSSGAGDGVILHADNSLVSSAKPAKAGEQVVVFCTGLGPTSPSFNTGSAVTATNATVNPVSVTIGGKSASVAYRGLTVGFAGLYQINAIVPSGLSGSQPVVVTVGSGNSSRAGVTVSVTP